jgi:hypothetical protein
MKDELIDAIVEPKPMFFGASHKETTIKKDHEAGRAGQPLFPDPNRCASGRHNKRLTQCNCGSIRSGK